MRGGETYRIANVGKARPEVRAPLLHAPVQYDVLDNGVPDVADRVDHRRCGRRDSTQIMCEGEDRPAVADGTEGCVLSVRERPVRRELRADEDVLASLIRGTSGLKTQDLARG